MLFTVELNNMQAATLASHSDQARLRSDMGGSTEKRAPFFPSAAVPSGPPDPSTVELKDEKSLMARSDDPEMATRVKLGGVCNTLLARFEYQRLEFNLPSEVVRALLTLACFVNPLPPPMSSQL